MKIILLNGPKSAGKDTIADAYKNYHRGTRSVTVLPMVRAMHENALAEYGLPADSVDVINRTGCKDQPSGTLGGKTPREVYIEYGDKMREKYGEYVFGDMWLKRAAMVTPEKNGVIIVPDVRFQPEVNSAIRLAGRDNVMLVYVIRPGKSWFGDIGRFCEHDWSCTFLNNGPLDGLGYRFDSAIIEAW